jgi:integrase
MGRKRSTHNNLPPRLAAMRRGQKTHYYYDQGAKAKPRYVALGSDYVSAIRKWADLEQGNAHKVAAGLTTFQQVATRYQAEIIPTKASRTQEDNLAELKNLLEFFGDGPLSKIEPLHIRQYREWRSTDRVNAEGRKIKGAKVRANREIALFSHIWNMAREWGATDRSNPCAGVKRNRETGRDIYIYDEEFLAILAHAKPVLADAMELAYLTGQRPADVLKMRETDIRDGCLEIRQGKTSTPMRIAISGRLEALVDRCKARKAGSKVHNTALVVGAGNRPIGMSWLAQLFKAAKTAAGIERDIQFRDLRAKAVSDKEEVTDIREAQALAGHSTVTMTEHYSRKRRGKKVEPTR